MKFSTSLLVVALQTVGVFSSNADAECVNLGGVMSIDGLPSDVDASAVRQCVNGPGSSPNAPSLEQRDCWYGKDSGCSETGYCFKKCGEKDSGMSYDEQPFSFL